MGQERHDRTERETVEADAVARLRALWDECFPDDGQPAQRKPDPWRDQRKEHLPLTLAVVLANLESLEHGTSEQGEPALLLTAGYSEEQIALCIAVHLHNGCRHVVPVAPVEVWETVKPEVLRCLEHVREESPEPEIHDPLVVDSGDPASVFNAILRWIHDHPDLRPVIDCTGGQKPMITGAGDAASFLGLPAYYLDFEQYDTRRRRPLPHTCRYRRLRLPEPAFSLQQRQATMQAFTSRRFDVAAVRARQVLEVARYSGYLEPSDLKDLEIVCLLAERSRQWMDLAYDHRLLEDHPLHELFRACRKAELPPRKVVEGLRSQPAENRFWSYLSDEYWRLQVLGEIGAAREALVGLVGLSELVVDSLFFLPWYRKATITSLVPRKWLRVSDHTMPLPGPSGMPGVGTCLAPGFLPPGFQQKKTAMLLRGRATFDIWLPLGPDGSPTLEKEPPEKDDPCLEARAHLMLDSPPLLFNGGGKARSRLWSRAWGSYPQGDWVMERHACAHTRAPLFDRAILEQARVVAPRFIELLYRLQQDSPVDITGSDSDEWVTWWHDKRWAQRSRLPWGADGDRHLAGWLRLPRAGAKE